MEPPSAENSSNQGPQAQAPQALPTYGPAPIESESFRPGPLRAIWQGRWIVLGITVLALVGAFVYLLKATPIYESTSRIYVEKEGPMIMTAGEGGVMTQSRNYLHTQVELFTSMSVLEKAVREKLEARSMKTFVGIQNLEMYLKTQCLDVSVGKKDEIISVSARSPYPREAAQIVNAVVDAYIEFHGTKKQTTGEQVRNILEEVKKKWDTKLTASLKAIAEFKKNSPVMLFESDEQNPSIKRVSSLGDALVTARLDTVDARSAYDALKTTTGTSPPRRELPAAVQARLSAAADEYRRRNQQLEQDVHLAEVALSRLQVEYTKDCPAVIAARDRIKWLRGERGALQERWVEQESQTRAAGMAAAVAADLAIAEQAYLRAKSREEMLAAAVKESSTEAADAIARQADYAVLASAKNNAETQVKNLDERIREITVTEDTGALNISILDVAKAGVAPVEPQKTRTMALALVAGLMLGAGLALLKDWLDHRLRSSDEMALVLGAPVLGVLPHVKESTVFQVGQLVHASPSSHTAEAFRTVRTAVYFNAEAKDAKTILVTSPAPGDGKSTVTSNLAIAMAQVGQRILLIDCDFRRPTQHKIFEINGQHRDHAPAIADVLNGRETEEGLIIPSGIDGLDVLPCLSQISNPGEILNGPDFLAFLKRLAPRYDRILLDAPPVLPVADARILGAVCDAAIVVLRAEKSGRKAAELTREALESVGTHILGTVVNAVPKRKGGHGQYGYYGVSRYYRYDKYRYVADDNGTNGSARDRRRGRTGQDGGNREDLSSLERETQ